MMALTTEDLRDLVELLRAHPEWREVLWALLASEDVLRLPAELAAFRAEAERRFAELAEAVRHLSEILVAHRQEFLAQQAQTEARFAELAEAIRRLSEEFAAHRREFLEYRAQTDRRLDRVERRQEDHRRDLGELLSMRLEALYHENPGLFRPPLRCASWRSWRRRRRRGGSPGKEADRAALLDRLVEGFHRSRGFRDSWGGEELGCKR